MRPSPALQGSHCVSLLGSLGALHDFDLITFRSVDKCETAAIGLYGWTVGIFQIERGEVLTECFQAVHFESKMREVRLHLDRAAGREMAKLDQFLALRRFHEYEFRAARRFVPADFLE